MRKRSSVLVVTCLFFSLLQNSARAADDQASASAVSALKTYLAQPADQRREAQYNSFAKIALTAKDATRAQGMIWDDFRFAKDAIPDSQSIVWNNFTMPYLVRIFGDKPAGGRRLFISLHGGGSVPKPVNDQQWNNQIELYKPAEGVYVAPRAPTDAWDMWHQPQIDEMLTRLISRMVLQHDVNPDRVYLMGYSAGGDGVYQLGPRMADHWAAATVSAGHPNDASPMSLRNIPFGIYVGQYDSAYNRNQIAVEWRDQLDLLQKTDAEGYQHVVEVVPGMGHWMFLKDAVSVPWMSTFTRNLIPKRIVWLQNHVTSRQFYWLTAKQPQRDDLVLASYSDQTIVIKGPAGRELGLLLNDQMVDLDQAIKVADEDGKVLFEGVVPRTIASLFATLKERGEPSAMFSARCDLPALD